MADRVFTHAHHRFDGWQCNKTLHQADTSASKYNAPVNIENVYIGALWPKWHLQQSRRSHPRSAREIRRVSSAQYNESCSLLLPLLLLMLRECFDEKCARMVCWMLACAIQNDQSRTRARAHTHAAAQHDNDDKCSRIALNYVWGCSILNARHAMSCAACDDNEYARDLQYVYVLHVIQYVTIICELF